MGVRVGVGVGCTINRKSSQGFQSSKGEMMRAIEQGRRVERDEGRAHAQAEDYLDGSALRSNNPPMSTGTHARRQRVTTYNHHFVHVDETKERDGESLYPTDDTSVIGIPRGRIRRARRGT